MSPSNDDYQGVPRRPTVDCKGDRVSPEVQRAFNVLLQNLPRQHELAVTDLPNQLLSTGFKAFSTDPITKYNIPHTCEWTWRQSNGKVLLALSGTDNVTIAKLSPRRTSSATTKQPSYKVWIFEINSENGNLWFLWCEKGEPVPITVRLAGSLGFSGNASYLKLPTLPTFTPSYALSTVQYTAASPQAVPTSPPLAAAPVSLPTTCSVEAGRKLPNALETELTKLEPLPFNSDLMLGTTGSFTKSLFEPLPYHADCGLSQSDLVFLSDYM